MKKLLKLVFFRYFDRDVKMYFRTLMIIKLKENSYIEVEQLVSVYQTQSLSHSYQERRIRHLLECAIQQERLRVKVIDPPSGNLISPMRLVSQSLSNHLCEEKGQKYILHQCVDGAFCSHPRPYSLPMFFSSALLLFGSILS